MSFLLERRGIAAKYSPSLPRIELGRMAFKRSQQEQYNAFSRSVVDGRYVANGR